MAGKRSIAVLTAVTIFTVSAGAVFAQNGNAFGQNDDTPNGQYREAAICRPETGYHERGEHLSELLGMDIEEIRDYIQSGGTIEELAEEKGIDLEAIREAYQSAHLAELESCLEQAVADGEITQEQADLILERAQTRMEENEFGPHHDGPFGNRPPRGNRPGRGPRSNGFFGPPASGEQI